MNYKNFGQFIRQKRISNKISLSKFAVETDIDSAKLSRIETLKQGVDLLTIAKIAEAYNMTVSELIKEYELR